MLSHSTEYAANLLLQFDRPGNDRSVGSQTDIKEESDSEGDSNSEADVLDKSSETNNSHQGLDGQEDSSSNSVSGFCERFCS